MARVLVKTVGNLSDATNAGLVGTGTQTFGGAKSLTDALTLGSVGTVSDCKISSKTYGLGAGSISYLTSLTFQGIVWVINATDNHPALFHVTESGVIVVADPYETWNVVDSITDNRIYYSGSQLTLKNASGGFRSFRVIMLGTRNLIL